LGIIVCFLIAIASMIDGGLLNRFDLMALDFNFSLRRLIKPRVFESQDIAHIDIDDKSIDSLGNFPWMRDTYAKLVQALTFLGVKLIVFDVEFSKLQNTNFSEDENEHILAPPDKEFMLAIGHSDKVIMPFSFDFSFSNNKKIREAIPKIKELLLKNKNFDADANSICKSAGLDVQVIEPEIEKIRRLVISDIIRDKIFESPSSSFKDVARSVFFKSSENKNSYINKIFQDAYISALSIYKIRSRIPIPIVKWGLSTIPISINPPVYYFAKGVKSFGFVNSFEDADGILRRHQAFLEFDNQKWLNIALVTAIKFLENNDKKISVEICDKTLKLKICDVSSEKIIDIIEVPVDSDGRMIINWISTKPWSETFTRIPYAKIIEFWQKRYEIMPQNFDVLADILANDKRVKFAKDIYLRKKDELTNLINDNKSAPDKVKLAEISLDKIRQAMLLKAQNVVDKDALASLQEPYLLEKKLRQILEGKICFIGSTSTSSGDLHSTPLGPATPGVNAHSNVVNAILTKQLIQDAPRFLNLIFIFFWGLIASMLFSFISPVKGGVVGIILIVIIVGVTFLLFQYKGMVVSEAGPISSVFLCFLTITTYREFTERRLERMLRKELEGKTSPVFVEEILHNVERWRKPQRIEATIFFSDIKGFTSISEKMEPTTMVNFINEYHSRISKSLLSNGAYLDKYMGDGIMAVFGVPIYRSNHPQMACESALENISQIKELNEYFSSKKLPSISLRIGINTGDMIAGYIGSQERADFTVMGDSVNVAAKLEPANKIYDTKIIISEFTHNKIGDTFVSREADIVRIGGRKDAIKIYELIGKKGALSQKDSYFLELYEKGLSAFRNKNWQDAIKYFEMAVVLNSNDSLSKLYIARSKKFIDNPPLDWDGIFDLIIK